MTTRGILLLVSLGIAVATQAQTFAGFLEVGPNLNQVQGDELAGWNNLGGFVGVGVYTDFSDRWRGSLTISFSQYGANATSREIELQRSIYDKISLNYVAVPFKVHYMDWLSEDETFYKLEFYAGAEYLRLISEEAVGIDGSDLIAINPYRQNGVNILGGAYYVWSLKWAAGLNYHTSITPMQQRAEERNQFLKQLGFRLRRTF